MCHFEICDILLAKESEENSDFKSLVQFFELPLYTFIGVPWQYNIHRLSSSIQNVTNTNVLQKLQLH